jgi:hypothetical protein
VATSVSRNANNGMVVPVLWSGGSMEFSGLFYVDAFGRNLASVAVKMFLNSIYFIKKLHKCTFNGICKDDAEINCIIVQLKKIHSRQL